MKKQTIILSIVILNSLMSIAQQSTLTATLVDRKYGFGYPSLTKKDGMGYPLIEALTIPNIYDATTNMTFKEEYSNLVGVKKDGKWGYINATGATVIPFKYDEAGYFHEGLAPVIAGGKCGFINKTGTLVIPMKYDYATSFTDGMAYVELGGKIGFINKTGTAVVPVKYDKQTDEAFQRCYHCGGAMNSFENGKAVVAMAGKCGVVDAKGVFTECADEALETITYKGVAKKDNPTAWIKGSCATNQDIRKITVNGVARNDIKTNFDNQTMFAYMSKIKAGDRVTIEIIHAKGCTYTLTRPDGFVPDGGQAGVDDKPVKPIGPGLDSTTFSGKVAGAMAILQSSIGAYDIKRVVLNDVDITAKLPVGQRKIINFPTYKLKTGQRVTLKIVHAKGSTIKMMDPKGIQ
jgi:hypothetical protein